MEVNIPAQVKQGNTLKINVKSEPNQLDGGVVWLGGKKVSLYEVVEGTYEGFMPISVFQKPGGYTVKVQNKQGATVHEQKVTVAKANFPIQNISVSSSTAGLQPLPGEMEAIQGLKDRVTAVRFWKDPFVSPTVDCQNSPFGVLRYHNGKPTDNYHKGVDLRSPAGRPIRAINDGKVVISKMYRLHGGTVGLDHGQGMTSVYIHMSKIAAKEGQHVKKGDVIGYVGSTGFATGPHLHWGLYVNGLPVEPNQWITGVPRC